MSGHIPTDRGELMPIHAPAALQVRALRGEEEVDAWLDFVAACFAFKGVPRRHFAAHFWSDPWRCARMIVVAETTPAPQQLLATLRIFDRRLYFKDGRIERVGGIGEVEHALSVKIASWL